MSDSAVIETLDPPEWEPATFVLSCARKHTWGSEGLYNARTLLVDLRFPACPFKGCGLGPVVQLSYTGPERPGVSEPAGVEPRDLGAVRTAQEYRDMLGTLFPAEVACRG